MAERMTAARSASDAASSATRRRRRRPCVCATPAATANPTSASVSTCPANCWSAAAMAGASAAWQYVQRPAVATLRMAVATWRGAAGAAVRNPSLGGAPGAGIRPCAAPAGADAMRGLRGTKRPPRSTVPRPQEKAWRSSGGGERDDASTSTGRSTTTSAPDGSPVCCGAAGSGATTASATALSGLTVRVSIQEVERPAAARARRRAVGGVNSGTPRAETRRPPSTTTPASATPGAWSSDRYRLGTPGSAGALGSARADLTRQGQPPASTAASWASSCSSRTHWPSIAAVWTVAVPTSAPRSRASAARNARRCRAPATVRTPSSANEPASHARRRAVGTVRRRGTGAIPTLLTYLVGCRHAGAKVTRRYYSA